MGRIQPTLYRGIGIIHLYTKYQQDIPAIQVHNICLEHQWPLFLKVGAPLSSRPKFYEAKTRGPNLGFLVCIMCIPAWELTYPPQKSSLKMIYIYDFPFPQVGYVNFLEGIQNCFGIWTCKLGHLQVYDLLGIITT